MRKLLGLELDRREKGETEGAAKRLGPKRGNRVIKGGSYLP